MTTNDVFMLYDRWSGLIWIALGIYFCLLAFGYLPRNPKDPERLKEWHRKLGPWMRVLAPCLVLAGIGQLAIGFAKEPTNPAARRVFNDFYRANDARSARGSSLSSAEQFLSDLKQIETAEAPDEVRLALLDYTKALEDGIKLIRMSQPTFEADSRMAAAHRQLMQLNEKYRK